MITLAKDLKWSPDGCSIEIVPKGEHQELPPRALKIAEQLGILLVDDGESTPNTGEQTEQAPTKKSKK